MKKTIYAVIAIAVVAGFGFLIKKSIDSSKAEEAERQRLEEIRIKEYNKINESVTKTIQLAFALSHGLYSDYWKCEWLGNCYFDYINGDITDKETDCCKPCNLGTLVSVYCDYLSVTGIADTLVSYYEKSETLIKMYEKKYPEQYIEAKGTFSFIQPFYEMYGKKDLYPNLGNFPSYKGDSRVKNNNVKLASGFYDLFIDEDKRDGYLKGKVVSSESHVKQQLAKIREKHFKE